MNIVCTLAVKGSSPLVNDTWILLYLLCACLCVCVPWWGVHVCRFARAYLQPCLLARVVINYHPFLFWTTIARKHQSAICVAETCLYSLSCG